MLRRVLHHAFDLRQPLDRFQPRLRLPRLAGLVAEPVDERLHMRALGGDALRRSGLLQRLLGADAHEFRVAARRQRDLLPVQMGDGIRHSGPAARGRATPPRPRRETWPARIPARAWLPNPDGWWARRAAAGPGWRTGPPRAPPACASHRKSRSRAAAAPPHRSRGPPESPLPALGPNSASMATSRS